MTDADVPVRRRRRVVAAVAVIGGVAACGWSVAGVAAADPGPPCPLALALMCRMLPVAPDLDDDVDLTRPTPPPTVGDGAVPPSGPPAS